MVKTPQNAKLTCIQIHTFNLLKAWMELTKDNGEMSQALFNAVQGMRAWLSRKEERNRRSSSLQVSAAAVKPARRTLSRPHCAILYNTQKADGHRCVRLEVVARTTLPVPTLFHSITRIAERRPSQSCPWVGLTHGLGWVGYGSRIFVFSGLG